MLCEKIRATRDVTCKFSYSKRPKRNPKIDLYFLNVHKNSCSTMTTKKAIHDENNTTSSNWNCICKLRYSKSSNIKITRLTGTSPIWKYHHKVFNHQWKIFFFLGYPPLSNDDNGDIQRWVFRQRGWTSRTIQVSYFWSLS